MGLDKITEYKKKKGWTNDILAQKSGVPKGTISKITSGITKNPQLDTLRAIADALCCRIEDFVENPLPLEPTIEQQDYYLSPEVSQMAQEIYDNPELRILFDASRKLTKDDVLAVVDIVKRMKGYNE